MKRTLSPKTNTREVPNAPCGVESVRKLRYVNVLFPLFLMRRVELKAQVCQRKRSDTRCVPNAPCGVESVGGLVYVNDRGKSS